METTKYKIVERRWSGNVIAKDVTDAQGKTKTTLMIHSFNKEYDHILADMCAELNKKESELNQISY